MDNLLSAFENGVPLTRTSSDPNLNKHCQEGRSALEPSPATDETSDEVIPDTGLESSEGEPLHESPAKTPEEGPGALGCEDAAEEPCLTTQPLPSLPLPPAPLSKDVALAHTPIPAPVLQQALPQITNPLPQPQLEAESPCRTATSTTSPTHESEPCLPLPCNSTQPAASTPTIPTSLLNGHTDGQADILPESEGLLALKQLTPLLPMEDSTETLTGEGDTPPALPPTVSHDLTKNHFTGEEHPKSQPPVQHQREKQDMRTDVVKGRERVLTVAAAPVDCNQIAARHLISQSQLSELSLLGSHWESVQGLVQSTCSSASHSGVSRALQPNTYQSRRLASKLLRSHGLAIANGSQCCRREALCCPSSPLQPGWLSAARSAGYAGLCGPAAAALNSYSLAGHQLLPVSYSSPSASSSSPPPQAPAYLDDDGLPVPMDAVQQRLRQIEAGYKQEVEVLRQQVRQLQMRLESKQYSTPPSEPDIDYEDDIVSSYFVYVRQPRSSFALRLEAFYCLQCCRGAFFLNFLLLIFQKKLDTFNPSYFLTLPSSIRVFRRVCVSQTTATRRILCPPTVRTVCLRAAGIEWSARTQRSVSFGASLPNIASPFTSSPLFHPLTCIARNTSNYGTLF